MPESFRQSHKAYSVRPGDILLTLTGDVGKNCLYTASQSALLNQRVCSLRAGAGLRQRFLYHYINQLSLDHYAVGSVQANLSKPTLSQMPVPLPPLDEQSAIIRFLDAKLDSINTLVAAEKQYRILLGKYGTTLTAATVTGTYRLEPPAGKRPAVRL